MSQETEYYVLMGSNSNEEEYRLATNLDEDGNIASIVMETSLEKIRQFRDAVKEGQPEVKTRIFKLVEIKEGH